MTQKDKKNYVAPKMHVLQLCTEGIIAMSGQGTDTNNGHDFGGRGTNERRQGWSTNWDNNWEHTWE